MTDPIAGSVPASELVKLNRWDAGFVLSYVRYKQHIERLIATVSTVQIRRLCIELPYDREAFRRVTRSSLHGYLPGEHASSRTVFEKTSLSARELATYLVLVFNHNTAREEIRRIREEAMRREDAVVRGMEVLGLLDQPGLFDAFMQEPK